MTTRMFSLSTRLKTALIELVFAASPAATLFCPTDVGAQAQPWPNRVVKIAVAGNPGSGPDLVARVLAEHLSAIWGQGVIVDNRIGGPGGNLIAQSVVRAAPDGYTILLGILPTLAMNQYLFKSTGFDAERDFAPIIRICIVPMMISVNAALCAELALQQMQFPCAAVKAIGRWRRERPVLIALARRCAIPATAARVFGIGAADEPRELRGTLCILRGIGEVHPEQFVERLGQIEFFEPCLSGLLPK